MWETNRESICMLINKTFNLVSKKSYNTKKQGGFPALAVAAKQNGINIKKKLLILYRSRRILLKLVRNKVFAHRARIYFMINELVIV